MTAKLNEEVKAGDGIPKEVDLQKMLLTLVSFFASDMSAYVTGQEYWCVEECLPG
jgi:hypothetical protein